MSDDSEILQFIYCMLVEHSRTAGTRRDREPANVLFVGHYIGYWKPASADDVVPFAEYVYWKYRRFDIVPFTC